MSESTPILTQPDRLALVRASVEVTRSLFELHPVNGPGKVQGIIVDGREGDGTIEAELVNKIVLAALDAQLRALDVALAPHPEPSR